MAKKVDGEADELGAQNQTIHLFSCFVVISLPAAQMLRESRDVTHPRHTDALPCAPPARNYL